jgi:hypothetical protein
MVERRKFLGLVKFSLTEFLKFGLGTKGGDRGNRRKRAQEGGRVFTPIKAD